MKEHMHWIAEFPSERNNRKSQDDKKVFCLFANGRTGSTFLVSSLARAENTSHTKEIKWEIYPSQPEVHRIHDVMHKTVRECCISAARKDLSDKHIIIGKYIFDPYTYLEPAIFERICKNMGPLDFPAMVYRDYFELFLSWNVKILYFDVNQDSPQEMAKFFSSDHMQDEIKKYTREDDPQKKISKVYLHKYSINETGLDHASAKCLSYDVVEMSYHAALDKILLLFHTDLFLFEALRRAPKIRFYHYRHIHQLLRDVVADLDISFSAQSLEDIIANPIVKKQKDHSQYLMDEDGMFKGIAKLLSDGMEHIIGQKLDPTKVWQWCEDQKYETHKRARIHIQDIGKMIRPLLIYDDRMLVDAHAPAYESLPSEALKKNHYKKITVIDDDTIIWDCNIPVLTYEKSVRNRCQRLGSNRR